MKTYGHSRDTVVLLHGLLGLFTSWRRNIPELAKSFTVVEAELPDYKDKPSGYTLKDYEAFVLDVLEGLGSEPVTIVGNSLGGHIATRLAALHPDRVDRLILITCSGLFDELAAHEKLIIRTPSEKNISQVIQHIFHDQRSCDASTVDEVVAYFVSNRRQRLRPLIRTARNLRKEDSTEDLMRITVPTLIIWGAMDRVVPVEIAHKFHALIKGSALRILDHCGHAPQIEQADQVNRLILEFCGKPLLTVGRGH